MNVQKEIQLPDPPYKFSFHLPLCLLFPCSVSCKRGSLPLKTAGKTGSLAIYFGPAKDLR